MLIKCNYYTPGNYATVYQGDDLFTFSPDGITVVPRANINIDYSTCPANYIDMIVRAHNRGWIKAVAHIPGKEATWARLNG